MTNYEKIKNMSIEELAELLNICSCDKCAYEAGEGIYCYNASEQGCKEGIRIWLNSEVEENADEIVKRRRTPKTSSKGKGKGEV